MYRSPVIAAALASLALSARARADAATAEVLFREGRRLMDAGDLAAACPKLSDSYDQDPATGTLLALAMCQEQAGKTASAWATYTQVVSRSRREGRVDREQAARERIEALEPKLSRLTIKVDASTAGTPGLVVKRDGVPLGRGTWDTAVPLDPGEHTIEATAPGKRAWTATVQIGNEGDHQSSIVGPLEAETAAPPPLAAVPPAPPEPAAATESSSSGGLGTQRIVALALGGVGVVGLGVGTIFALKAMSKKSDAEKVCDGNACESSAGAASGNDAHDAGNIATIGMIVGGVGLAGGLTLWFTAPAESPGASVGLGLGTVQARGTW